MPTAATLVLLAASQGAPEEMRLASLEKLLTPLAAEAGYALNLPERLAGRPVVFTFATKVRAMERMLGLARALDLEITLSADGRTLDVQRDPKAKGLSLEKRIEVGLAEYRTLVGPWLGRTMSERHEEAERLQRLSNAALDVKDYDGGREYSRRGSYLSQTATSTGEAIARTLVTVGDPATFARRNSRANAVKLPSAVIAGLGEYLAGRGVHLYDYSTDEALRGYAEETRARGAALGRGAPILELRHGVGEGGLWVGLRGTTPVAIHLAGSETIPIPPAGEVHEAGIVGDLPGADQPFEPKMPFRFAQVLSHSRVGSAAIPMGLDHASWFRTEKSHAHHHPGNTLRSWFRSSFPLPVRVRREGSWLLVENLDGAWPEYRTDWRPFDMAKALVEGPPPSPAKLLAWLDGVKERDLTALEDLLPESSEWDVRYTGVTSGVRLLRAALRETGGEGFDKPIGELSPAARTDAKRFFAGAYVWEYFTWLSHPANTGFLNKIRLKAMPERGVFRTTIAFPKGMPMPSGLTEAVFTVPMDQRG